MFSPEVVALPGKRVTGVITTLPADMPIRDHMGRPQAGFAGEFST